MLGILIVIVISIAWIICLCKKNWSPYVPLFVSMTVYYDSFISNIDIDLIIKIMFLMTTLIYVIQGKVKKKLLMLLIGLTILIYSISLLNVNFDWSYSRIDSITAISSFSTGIMLACIDLDNQERISILKTIQKLPIISLILGIPLSAMGFLTYFARSGTAVAGASSETNLAFFSTLAILAAIILKQVTQKSRYDVAKVVNYIIVCSTLTRGGILASTIILLPDIIAILMKAFIKAKYLIISFYGLAISVVPVIFIWKKISERTFENGQINTSGRLDAWKYIISLVRNRLTGNGYGSLKTMDYDPRLAAFTAAHNEFVRAFFESGLIGTVGLISIFICMLIFFLKKQKNMTTYILFAFIAFFVYSFTDNCITNYRYWFVFTFIISSFSGSLILLKRKSK